MPYIILSKSQKKHGEMVALVDRTKCQDHWWTEIIESAVIFTSKNAAEIQCSKLKFNKPKVWEYNAGKKRLGQVEVIKQRSAVSDALNAKQYQWHDDDWYEGIND